MLKWCLVIESITFTMREGLDGRRITKIPLTDEQNKEIERLQNTYTAPCSNKQLYVNDDNRYEDATRNFISGLCDPLLKPIGIELMEDGNA